MHRSGAYRFFILYSLSLTLYSPAFGQDKTYARQIIDTLCSPYFAGRGYVEDGYKKAAIFLEEEFKAIGLEPVTDAGFQQYFTMGVNTFPGEMEVGLSKRPDRKIKLLEAGDDYILNAQSNGAQPNHYHLWKFDSLSLSYLNKRDSNVRHYSSRFYYCGLPHCALTYDLKHKDILLNWDSSIHRSNFSAAVEFTNGSLVWSVGRDTTSVPIIQIKAKKLKKRYKYIHLNIDQEYIPNYTSSNVIGLVRNPHHPDTFIVIGAHLDHLGKMGSEAMFPGANDNASGIAIMLDMARYFANPEVRDELPFSIIFIGFGAEEAGLVGSKYFVENPPVPLSKIGFMINMDLMGNGQDGMMVVNGNVYQDKYEKLSSLNKKRGYLKEIKSRGKAANSDHYWFSENGVPSFFFYLLGEYPWYHDIYDTPEKPNLAGYEGAFKLITEFVRELR